MGEVLRRCIPQAGWYDKPMRWAQISFAEDDPGNYDPQFWLDYFKRLHVEAVTLNAGGAVAFYPTQVPFHYRSKWLGNMDTFGDLAEELPGARHGRCRADGCPCLPSGRLRCTS